MARGCVDRPTLDKNRPLGRRLYRVCCRLHRRRHLLSRHRSFHLPLPFPSPYPHFLCFTAGLDMNSGSIAWSLSRAEPTCRWMPDSAGAGTTSRGPGRSNNFYLASERSRRSLAPADFEGPSYFQLFRHSGLPISDDRLVLLLVVDFALR